MADITAQQPVTIQVHNKQHGTPISRDLWGIFLEDINYAVDGGLNADLVQNGAFEYNRTDKPRWSHLFGWTINHTGDGFPRCFHTHRRTSRCRESASSGHSPDRWHYHGSGCGLECRQTIRTSSCAAADGRSDGC